MPENKNTNKDLEMNNPSEKKRENLSLYPEKTPRGADKTNCI